MASSTELIGSYQRDTEIARADLHPTSSTNIIFHSTPERERPRRRHYEESSTAYVLEPEVNLLTARDEDEVASTTSTSMNTIPPPDELESCRSTPYSSAVPQPPPNDEVSSASEAEHVQFAHTRTTNTTTTTSAAAMKKHKSTTTNVVESSPTSTSSSSMSGAGGSNAAGGSGSVRDTSRESYVVDLVESTTSSNPPQRRLSDDQPSTSHHVRLRDAAYSGSYWQNLDEESNDHSSQAWNLHKPSSSTCTTQPSEAQHNTSDDRSSSSSENRFHLRYTRSDERLRVTEEEGGAHSSKIQRLNSNHTGAVHNDSMALVPATPRETTPNASNGSYVITYAGHQPPSGPVLPPPALPNRRRRMETISSSDQAQNFVITNQSSVNIPSHDRDLDDQPSTSRGRGRTNGGCGKSQSSSGEPNTKPPAVLTAPDLQLDWLSDATTTTSTDGDDDEVVFVHSSREPILSIDLTADDESSLALEMTAHDIDQADESLMEALIRRHASTSTISTTPPQAIASADSGAQCGNEWFGIQPMLMQPSRILSPSSTEPQRAHQSTSTGHSAYAFHSTSYNGQRSQSAEGTQHPPRLWQGPCMDCYMPEANNEASAGIVERMPQVQSSANQVHDSSSLEVSSNSMSTVGPHCHSTNANTPVSRLRTVWHPYLPETTSPQTVENWSSPLMNNSPMSPIFISNPYAVSEHNSSRFVNTSVSSMPPVPSMGLVRVINPNAPPSALQPTAPLYLQPSLQDGHNQRPINPPPLPHLASPSGGIIGNGSTTPSAHQYHPHSMYHHSHSAAHTATRPHENHIITHNHHGHAMSHSSHHGHPPHSHSLTFRPGSSSHGGPPPPYLVHQNLWLRQHNVQEIHRRHMTPTPIDLSSNPLNLTSSFRTRFQQMPNVCSCVHGRNGPVSSLDPVSFF